MKTRTGLLPFLQMLSIIGVVQQAVSVSSWLDHLYEDGGQLALQRQKTLGKCSGCHLNPPLIRRVNLQQRNGDASATPRQPHCISYTASVTPRQPHRVSKNAWKFFIRWVLTNGSWTVPHTSLELLTPWRMMVSPIRAVWMLSMTECCNLFLTPLRFTK